MGDVDDFWVIFAFLFLMVGLIIVCGVCGSAGYVAGVG